MDRINISYPTHDQEPDLVQCAPMTLLSAYLQYVCAENLRRLLPFHMKSKNVPMQIIETKPAVMKQSCRPMPLYHGVMA